MGNSLQDRIAYLNKQKDYYRSIGDHINVEIYSAVINELSFWEDKCEIAEQGDRLQIPSWLSDRIKRKRELFNTKEEDPQADIVGVNMDFMKEITDRLKKDYADLAADYFTKIGHDMHAKALCMEFDLDTQAVDIRIITKIEGLAGDNKP